MALFLLGLLPRQQISTSPLVRSETYDLKQIYFLGQLVRCRVWKYDSVRQQVKMSLIMDGVEAETADAGEKVEEQNGKEEKEEEEQEEEEKGGDEYEIGDLIEEGTVVQVSEENEYFRVKLPRGTKNGKSFF